MSQLADFEDYDLPVKCKSKIQKEWSEEVLGSCDLGDYRRLARLIDYGARQAAAPEASVAKSLWI